MSDNKTIPAACGFAMISTGMRRLMATAVTGLGVVYDNGGITRDYRIAFSITEPNIACDATALQNAISRGHTVGREVVSAVVSCGGLIPHDVQVSTNSAEIEAIREAITHFYVSETDAEARQALRAIYRHLGRLAVAA